MLDRLATWSRVGVPAGVSRLGRRAVPVALCAALFAVAGALWPLRGSPVALAPTAFPSAPTASAADSGRIDGFLAMARWGRPAYDAEKARRDAEGAGLNPKLARLGVTGITSSGGSHAVRLVRPDGTSERLTDGEHLPDGRVLVSVTANALVLEDADGGREELLLFPRLGGVTVADEPPTDGEALP